MSDLWERDAADIADAVRGGTLSARDVLEEHLARIERIDPDLNSVCFLDADAARTRADEVDRAVAAGDDPGPLAGVPMGVKELASVRGWPETHASVVYKDAIAEADDTEVSRLRDAGAVLVGLTTASEHGAVSFCNTPLHGITRNPWNTDRTSGGSSGGSAAAVAAGLFPACTGSDGGGSIRIPAAYSGLPGMKTTYGLTGTGPGPFSFSQTSVRGPMVRSVRDAARYLDVVTGPTLTDPVSLPKPEPFEPAIAGDGALELLRGKKVAWSATLGYASTDPAVERCVRDAAEVLIETAGLELVEVDASFPKPGTSWTVLSTINDMAVHYEDMRDHVEDLTDVMRLAVSSYEHLKPEIVLKAVRGRLATVAAGARVFEGIDMLLTPTTPVPAFAAEGQLSGIVNDKEVSLMGLSAAFTAPFNLTGQPAMSIPVGFVDGLPVALQVVARRLDDVSCLAAAAVLEQAHPWPKLAPLAYVG
jgi:aspartyl-tRNA(Asn)/glutamyl-tRNA(Gln) amidotransferase subunit A